MHLNEPTWIWEYKNWYQFTWDENTILPLLRETHLKLGVLIGKTETVDKEQNLTTSLDTLLQNIISSSAIEGEKLNVESVRSSLAERMGIQINRQQASERSEGLALMMLDATDNLNTPLSLQRLFKWHEWLFPPSELRLYDIEVGKLRCDDPMQVVSGRIDKPKVHFEAPPKKRLQNELTTFINWFNASRTELTLDPLLRAAITHLWFITLHPFDDGNGRITRALTDLALAQLNKQSIHLYSMSPTILKNRRTYYEILESTQRHSPEITRWIKWFLEVIIESINNALKSIENTLRKSRFWQTHQRTDLSPEQRKVLNYLLDEGEHGFPEGIYAAKYQKLTKVSKATATRHLSDLLNKGCIEKLASGGRSTRYRIKN